MPVLKIVLSAIFVIIISTIYGQTINTNSMIQEDTVVWETTLKEIPFTNKRGKVIGGMSDLFLEKEGKSYFIKLSAGKILRTELKEFIGKKIKVELILRKGNWDTPDDNNYQQSRTGEYVGILKLLE